MLDVVIIGGGEAGLTLAGKLAEAKLNVGVVEKTDKPVANDEFLLYKGIGVVKSPNAVTVLDPNYGDEQRILECNVIVIATGICDPSDQASKMLGIDKLGIRQTSIAPYISVNSNGETSVDNIFAVGHCTDQINADPVRSIIEFCSASSRNLESH